MIKTIGTKKIYVSYGAGVFWFSVFGKGLHMIDRSTYKPLFSVRNGYVKEYRIGKWGIKVLND